MADYYDVRAVVTGKFYKRHIVSVRASSAGALSEAELDEVAKKLAENVYQARDVPINTVVVLGWKEAVDLKAEVQRLQEQYEKEPEKLYTSEQMYPLYQRGGAAPADKKRASFVGRRRFHYKVAAVHGEHGCRFKINHFDGMV